MTQHAHPSRHREHSTDPTPVPVPRHPRRLPSPASPHLVPPRLRHLGIVFSDFCISHYMPGMPARRVNVPRIQQLIISTPSSSSSSLPSQNTISNLAIAYSDQGKFTEAEKLQVELMSVDKRVLGADHPDTLAGLGNLGTTYCDMGKYAKAAKLQAQVLATQKRVLGTSRPTHSVVLPPRFLDATLLPLGLRPQPGSPLLEGGVDVGVSCDWAGAALEAGTPPSIGVFQEAAHAAMPPST